MPQMIDAECTSPPYMPHAASWPISRNGEPGSRSRAPRSRGSILPPAVCLSRADWSPPWETVATFSRRSETRACMRPALARNSSERGLSWLLIAAIRALSSFLQRTADDQSLDVVRALVDLGHAHVAPQALDREVRDVAVAAVDLDRVRADRFRHLGSEQLRHRGFLQAGLAGVAQPRGMQVELARGLDLGGHVGEAEVHRLVLDQVLAHALALARVGGGSLERGARHAGCLRRDVDAARLEVGERDTVADAFLSEHVVRGNPAVLEDDLRRVRCALAGFLLDARDHI